MSVQLSGKCVLANSEQIMSRWEDKASREVAAAATVSHLVLRDHLPQFLTNLVEILSEFKEGDNWRAAVTDKIKLKFSKEHGRARASTKNYSLSQLQQEYAILREVITEVLVGDEFFSYETSEIVNRMVEWSLIVSGQEFVDSLSRVQEKLMGTISHDLRNPISTAYSALESINNFPNIETRNEFIQLSLRSLEHALRLLNELLDSAQVQAGTGMSFNFEKTDLAKEIEFAVIDAKNVYTNKLSLHKNASASYTGVFDKIAVRRVLENLVSNAVKYGGINTPVIVGLEQSDKDSIVLSVNNKGSLIREEDKDSIFDFLNRTNSKISNKKEGWGIGLFLVKVVAQAHGGRAWVDSNETEGTTFSLELERNYARDGDILSQLM